jgi:N6-adenosine-specific RNA methylase IME4/ParB-like chromosome segregation protein Spo0J
MNTAPILPNGVVTGGSLSQRSEPPFFNERQVMELEFHPLANIFPLIEGAEFDALVDDIRANGLRENIVLLDGAILDGRNRYRACLIAGTQPRTVEYFGDDPVSFVVSLNLRRRHLDESQRAIVAAKLANMRQGNFSKAANLPVSPVSQSSAADMLNVSERTVRSARTVIDEGAPELVEAVEHGRVSVSAASDLATLPKQQQTEIVARGEKEILEAAKAIRQEKAEARRAELELVKQNKPELPTGKYETIIIDPPWQMEKIERDVAPNQVAFEYPTMNEEELAEFDVPSIASDDCHLFCWTTHKFLPSAMRLIEAWGFRYVYLGTWHKNGGFQPFGLPQYNSEFYVYARKGTPRFSDTKQFFTCFHAQRREHSRKPDEFYDVIRRVTDGPRIDVFSREPRDGFDQFGNEAKKFSEDAA